MERLTIQYDGSWSPMELCTFDRYGGADDCDACYECCEGDCSTCPLQKCFDKLAAYEDTGLTPERCAELAKADKEGRLVELPCKVGDTVYVVDTDSQLNYAKMIVAPVDNFVICDDGEILLESDAYYGAICTAESIQKGTLYLGYYKAFLIQKEAEKALEEAEKALERENKA